MRKIKAKKSEQKKQTDGKYYLHMLVFFVIGLAVAAACMVLIPYFRNREALIPFTDASAGQIKDNSTGITYAMCSGNLSARNVGKAFAEIDGIKLYRIYTVNGTEVGTENYIADEDGIIFRNTSVKEITLDTFNAIGAYIFYEDSPTGGELFPKKEYLPDDEKDRDDIPDDSALTNEIVSLMTGDKTVVPTGMIMSRDTFELKLCSSEHPAFYYSVFCMRDENGAAFLYDASENRYFDCPDKLAVRLWGSD